MKAGLKATLVFLALFTLMSGAAAYAQDDGAAQAQIEAQQAMLAAQMPN